MIIRLQDLVLRLAVRKSDGQPNAFGRWLLKAL